MKMILRQQSMKRRKRIYKRDVVLSKYHFKSSSHILSSKHLPFESQLLASRSPSIKPPESLSSHQTPFYPLSPSTSQQWHSHPQSIPSTMIPIHPSTPPPLISQPKARTSSSQAVAQESDLRLPAPSQNLVPPASPYSDEPKIHFSKPNQP
jgi:hypothetical protein